MYSLNIYIDNILWRTDYKRTWEEIQDMKQGYMQLNGEHSKMIYEVSPCEPVYMDDAK